MYIVIKNNFVRIFEMIVITLRRDGCGVCGCERTHPYLDWY